LNVCRRKWYLGVARALSVPYSEAHFLQHWDFPEVRELVIDARLAHQPHILPALLSCCGPFLSAVVLRGKYGPPKDGTPRRFDLAHDATSAAQL
jgi:hypothetical protein